jgi:hypothetical protein
LKSTYATVSYHRELIYGNYVRLALSACATSFAPQWIIYVGKSASEAASGNVLFSSQEECMEHCLNNSCYAVDMVLESDTEVRCWVFEDPLSTDGPDRTGDGIVHARIADRCPSCT